MAIYGYARTTSKEEDVMANVEEMFGPFNSEVQRVGLLSYARIFFI